MIINPFATPININGVNINNYSDACIFTLKNKSHSALQSKIFERLKEDPNYNIKLRNTPKMTKQIKNFKKSKKVDINSLNQDLDNNSQTVHKGQILIHCGNIFQPNQNSIKLSKPLSTSLCPQVCFINGIWGGKAFRSNKLQLIKIELSSDIEAYYYGKRVRPDEKEILIKKETIINIKSRHVVCKNEVSDGTNEKKVDFEFIEAYI